MIAASISGKETVRWTIANVAVTLTEIVAHLKIDQLDSLLNLSSTKASLCKSYLRFKVIEVLENRAHTYYETCVYTVE